MSVFLSHNSCHKPVVESIANRLRAEGLDPWLDKWNLIPGEPWQEALEHALEECSCCLVFIGTDGLGPWQNEEMRRAIERRVQDGNRFRVVPVLLPGCDRPDRGRLPGFLRGTTWVEFGSAGDNDAFHRLLCGIHGQMPGPGPLPGGSNENPYRGLLAFGQEHASTFFGREALTDWLLDELRPKRQESCENRFLALIGPSGSGKSSLAQAGVIASLKRGSLHGSSKWPVIHCRPGVNPLESLAVAVAANPSVSKASDANEVMARMMRHSTGLHLLTKVGLHNESDEQRVLIFVDQFEELFTQCKDVAIQKIVVDNLLYAATVPQGRVVALLTMRADFYGECANFPDLAFAISKHQQLIGPMSSDELRRAIEMPAHVSGSTMQAGLVDLILRDVGNQIGSLPLLQYALSLLWQLEDTCELTVSSYLKLGGINGALEKRANEFFSTLTESEVRICKSIFLRMIDPGIGRSDSKKPLKLIETDLNSAVTSMIDKLIEWRLVVAAATSEKELWYELAHESLIHNWSKLREWIDERRDSLQAVSRLRQAIGDWESNACDVAFLMEGRRLASIEAAIQSDDVQSLSERELAYLKICHTNEAEAISLLKNASRPFFVNAVSLILVLWSLLGIIIFFGELSSNLISALVGLVMFCAMLWSGIRLYQGSRFAYYVVLAFGFLFLLVSVSVLFSGNGPFDIRTNRLLVGACFALALSIWSLFASLRNVRAFFST